MSTLSGMVKAQERLRAWLAREGLTQREAGKLLGIHWTFLNQLLSTNYRKRCPSMRTASRIERVTGIPIVAWMPTDVDRKKRQPRKRTETAHVGGA